MNWLKAFFANHSITTHTLAGAVATLTLLYASVPAFHDLAYQLYQATPSWFHQIFAAALGIWAFYHGTSKQ